MRNNSRAGLKEIVNRCRAGEKAAWHELVDIIAPVIFSICRKMSLSREESFDIFGQVCAVLVSRIDNLRSAGKVVSYTATITYRKIRELYKRTRLFDSLSDHALAELPDSHDKVPDRLYEAARRSRALAEAMMKLPDREYSLITALFLEGDSTSYQELSRRLNIPVSSIGPTRARTLRKLQRLLKEQPAESRRLSYKTGGRRNKNE